MAVLTAPQLGTGGSEPQTGSALVALGNNGIVIPVNLLAHIAAPAYFDLIHVGDPGESGMFVWQRSIVDADGSVLPGARVEVRNVSTGALAEIFANESGTPKSNPFLVDSDGFARFYALPGFYNITATDEGLEREWERELLGVPLSALPDLTGLITPIAAEIVADAIAAFADELDIPEGYKIVGWFIVDAGGTLTAGTAGFSATFNGGSSNYTLTHNLNLAPNSYLALIQPSAGGGGHLNTQPALYAANSFTYSCFDDENGLVFGAVRGVLVVNETFGT